MLKLSGIRRSIDLILFTAKERNNLVAVHLRFTQPTYSVSRRMADLSTPAAQRGKLQFEEFPLLYDQPIFKKQKWQLVLDAFHFPYRALLAVEDNIDLPVLLFFVLGQYLQA